VQGLRSSPLLRTPSVGTRGTPSVGSRVKGILVSSVLRFRILGFYGQGRWVQGSGFGVQGSGFRVQGLGFRV
jgi:hypothetical protein